MFVLGTMNETLDPAPSVQGPLKVVSTHIGWQLKTRIIVHLHVNAHVHANVHVHVHVCAG